MIIVFYSLLTVIMGFIGTSINMDTGIQTTDYDGMNSWSSDIPVVNNVVTGFSSLPLWVNTVIFTPLIIILFWIVLTTIVPTVDSGA